MTSWTKEAALRELRRLITEIDGLMEVRRQSADHIRWLAQTLRFLEEVFGRSSRYYMTLAGIPWSETGGFIVQGLDPTAAIERKHQEAYVKQLDSSRGLLQAALDELISVNLEDVYEGKDTPPETSDILRVLNLVERKLRKIIRTAPKKEVEVQESVENLLIAADIDHSREKESIEYSSKSYIPDFVLSRLDLALEVKLSAKPRREKEIVSEINDDIIAYKTKYGNIVFVVYDVGCIRDVDRFIDHFETHDGVLVRVVKH